MNKIYLKLIITFILATYLTSCTEPFALVTNDDEKTLVIEATIINKNVKQKIKLSRSFNLQENQNTFEKEAIVYIKDNNNNVYTFDEKTNYYESNIAFGALPNTEYQLYITTNDGVEYKSQIETLPSEIPFIDNVTASVANKDGERGVAVTVKANDAVNTSKFYRYEYESTYKIIAPYWSGDSLKVTGTIEPNIIFEVIQRNVQSESKTCYNKEISKTILVNNTTNLNSNGNFQLVFLSQMNPKIAHRYSILVKQYTQNQGSNSYYTTLKKISESSGTLSGLQPGFIMGNIKSTNSTNKVIGYFDVCSYTEKRMFFNYADLFPGEPLPPYHKECDVLEYDSTYISSNNLTPAYGMLNLAELSRGGNILYYNQAGIFYNMVAHPACGDCRLIGSNAKPSFWLD